MQHFTLLLLYLNHVDDVAHVDEHEAGDGLTLGRVYHGLDHLLTTTCHSKHNQLVIS